MSSVLYAFFAHLCYRDAVMAEQMLTVHDVAAAAQVSEKTVRRWLKEGLLRGVRLGGTKIGWRISEADFKRFINGTGRGTSR